MADLLNPRLSSFLSDGRDGVFYLSHASVLVTLSGRRYLFDPVLAKPPHLGSWLFFPEMIRDPRLLEVDGVFVSHQHQDHCDIDYLRQLSQGTKVYIVAGRPAFTKIFRDAGVEVTELGAESFHSIDDDVVAFGIEHDYNGIDAAIAIRNGNFTLFHGNDCFLSQEKLDRLKLTLGRVHVACVPFAYVHWYPFLLDDVDENWREAETTRLVTKYLFEGIRFVKTLQPDVAIPFGANMFYFDDVESTHNQSVLTPFHFKSYADKTFPDISERILPLFAGDYALMGQDGALQFYRQGRTLAGLMADLQEFIQLRKKIGVGIDLSHLISLINDAGVAAAVARSRLQSACISPIDHIIYISNAEAPADGGYVKIDLLSGSVDCVESIDGLRDYHHFKLTDVAFKAYLSGRYTFNEIVASSRFRLSRFPN